MKNHAPSHEFLVPYGRVHQEGRPKSWPRTADQDDLLADDSAHCREAVSDCVRVSGKHRLDPMSGDLGEIGVVDSSRAHPGHVAMSALVGADVQAGSFLGRLPDVAVEVPLAPHAPARRREDQLSVGAVDVDLDFEHPGQGGRDGDDAAGGLLAVVGLGALEDLALVGGAADLEGLAVEVLGT